MVIMQAETQPSGFTQGITRLSDSFAALGEQLPLFLFGFLIFITFAFLGHFVAKREKFWDKITRNPFLAEIASQMFRMAFIILGLVIALEAAGARSLLGTILGAAGITGIAIGFAVKDTIDNYVSSLMLSFNQPFRPNDYIVIGAHQGRVIRMTTRATILMTSDGNHLRIPNAMVYKSPILNYTRIPERRFTFDIGIASDDDPQAAVKTGVDVINAMPFILDDPEAYGFIKDIADSSIVLTFRGWITQENTSFTRARSLALRAVKTALEEGGFEMPNPSFNISFDRRSGPLMTDIVDGPEEAKAVQKSFEIPPVVLKDFDANDEAKVDNYIRERVIEERASGEQEDMLDVNKPTE
ncbi:MAG: mechanosensitive ion channel family protein [Alphaproteobacteria bacterium]